MQNYSYFLNIIIYFNVFGMIFEKYLISYRLSVSFLNIYFICINKKNLLSLEYQQTY
jgi:hypothetical protein